MCWYVLFAYTRIKGQTVLRKPTINYTGSAQNPGEYKVSINMNIYETCSCDYVTTKLSSFCNDAFC
jgi:hypothetical protein